MLKTMHTYRRVIVAVLLGSLFFYVFYQKIQGGSTSVKRDNPPFPAVQVDDLYQDRVVSLNELTQSPCIVHIWASWCGVCLREHAVWNTIQEKWHIPVVGIVYRDDVQAVKHFIDAKGMPYAWLLHDKSGRLGVALGLVGTPQTYLVDAKGRIVREHIGALSEKQFEKIFLPEYESLNGVS